MTKQEFLDKHGEGSENKACKDALNWIASLPKTYNAKQIWNACKRSDWMLWYLERTIDNNDPRFRLMACAFVRRTPTGDGKFVWDLLTDDRSKRAVEVSEMYAVGKATDEELATARAASWDAYRLAWDSARATYDTYMNTITMHTSLAARYIAMASSDTAWAFKDYARAAAWSASKDAKYYAWAVARDAARNAWDDVWNDRNVIKAAMAEQCNITREFFPEP